MSSNGEHENANDERMPAQDGNRHAARLRTPLSSLEARCRSTIVANLERYPPEALGILSEDSWESVVLEKHQTTTPSMGSGGIDGTGRLLPAITDRFLAEVEQANPHLSESAVVDQLVWKDCVEYKFKAGGLTRPAALRYPWPILVDRLRQSGDGLLNLLQKQDPSDEERQLLGNHVQVLSESPMSVALLQASGVGKIVKRFVKGCRKERECPLTKYAECPMQSSLKPSDGQSVESQLVKLEQTLQKWKNIAASSGVQINSTDEKSVESPDGARVQQDDMNLVESCQSWRDLFLVLQQREEKRRATQGARMRKIRKELATGRPRVIKVRHTNSRFEKILNRPKQKQQASASSSAVASGNSKMRALRKESAAATLRQKSTQRSTTKKSPPSFGAAVAFAAKVSPSSANKTGRTVSLAGGKQLKLPAKAKKGPQTLRRPGQRRI